MCAVLSFVSLKTKAQRCVVVFCLCCWLFSCGCQRDQNNKIGGQILDTEMTLAGYRSVFVVVYFSGG